VLVFYTASIFVLDCPTVGTVVRMGENYYELLGVSEDASTDDIETAYRERLKETHPDVSDDEDANEPRKHSQTNPNETATTDWATRCTSARPLCHTRQAGTNRALRERSRERLGIPSNRRRRRRRQVLARLTGAVPLHGVQTLRGSAGHRQSQASHAAVDDTFVRKSTVRGVPMRRGVLGVLTGPMQFSAEPTPTASHQCLRVSVPPSCSVPRFWSTQSCSLAH
jgi:hypothetical protein